jgi:hypothetical protein
LIVVMWGSSFAPACEHAFVTSQGTPGGRFSRAIKQRNLWGAEMALREMRQPSLLLLLDYLELLAELKPEKLPLAAMRWHGRLQLEASPSALTLADSQLALAALSSLCSGDREALVLLRRLLRRAQPLLVPPAE